ncbi:MAG: class I SAM-dependent methyltransferase [Crocosphaera sp.]|nr:class I SAM-dependent methyltransferase [Crocosphaera sp.]
MFDSTMKNNWYENFNLKEKSRWYNQIADAYDKTRPRYPQKLIDQALQVTKVSSNANILEIGCGPGILTTALAELGFSLIGLEPSLEAYKIACEKCSTYSKVKIINTTFEEWELQRNLFDAVVAATSFHWISSKIRYPKTAKSLKNNGFLILFWNTPPQPSYDTYQESLESIYQTYVPGLKGYEDILFQQQNLNILSKMTIESGKFKHLFSDNLISKVTYTIDDFLGLLSTLSPYIAMKSETRNILFERLSASLTKNNGKMINLSYLSVLQIFEKI